VSCVPWASWSPWRRGRRPWPWACPWPGVMRPHQPLERAGPGQQRLRVALLPFLLQLPALLDQGQLGLRGRLVRPGGLPAHHGAMQRLAVLRNSLGQRCSTNRHFGGSSRCSGGPL
jgi:hypothetical protein